VHTSGSSDSVIKSHGMSWNGIPRMSLRTVPLQFIFLPLM
jgi:hypothetical protein